MADALPPIRISFMLACFVSSDPENVVGTHVWNSDAGHETRLWLRDNELIGEDDRPTDKGAAWVGYICQTPFPIQTWKLPKRPTKDEAHAKGGYARAASLSPDRRKEIARKAANSRWGQPAND